MALRQINIPLLGRNLSTLMVAPSSAEADTHEAGLTAYHRLGGTGIHLHGEGGETHSRQVVGTWLRTHHLREEFFLCAQICHDDWDDTAKQPINRFTPEAVQEDIATHLQLIGTDYLDLVYLDDRPEFAFEPVIDTLGREIANQRVRAFGVRNTSPDRIRAADSYARKVIGHGIAALITTELSLFQSTAPLWSDYLPFDAAMQEVVCELGLMVLAHANDMTLGQCLFGDEEAFARIRPEWIQRWQHPDNQKRIECVNEMAIRHELTTREIQMAWLLNQPFPVVAIISLPALLTDIGQQYERGSQRRIVDADQFWLQSLR